MIDLHMHSNASDGKHAPKELVDLALKTGLRAIALTDHDAIAGIDSAMEAAKGKGLEVVPGIEINCKGPGEKFKEAEVVGLFIDYKHPEMVKFAVKAKKEREDQKKKILEKLQKLGFEISFEELQASAKGSMGRPHIAQLLMKKYPEKVSSIREAFEKYLGVGKPAFVERKNKFSIRQAIELVEKTGGIALLAHPGVFPREASLELIEFFKKNGGNGIETYYPYHLICPWMKIGEKENQEMIEFYQKQAKALGLLESGGSDFHGGDRNTFNAVKIPDIVLEKLKQSL